VDWQRSDVQIVLWLPFDLMPDIVQAIFDVRKNIFPCNKKIKIHLKDKVKG